MFNITASCSRSSQVVGREASVSLTPSYRRGNAGTSSMRVKGSLSHLPPWHQAPVLGTTGASIQALLHFPPSHGLPDRVAGLHSLAGSRALRAQLHCEAEAGFQGSGAPSELAGALTAWSSPSIWKAPRSSAGKCDAISLVKWHQVAKKMWHRHQREREGERAPCWLGAGRGYGGPYLTPSQMWQAGRTHTPARSCLDTSARDPPLPSSSPAGPQPLWPRLRGAEDKAGF